MSGIDPAKTLSVADIGFSLNGIRGERADTAEESVAKPSVDRMADQQQRETESRSQPKHFEPRQIPFASAVERAQDKSEMHRGGAVEEHRQQRDAPEREREAERAFGERQRKDAERVVKEMQADIGKQHQSRQQAQPAKRE